MNDQSEAAAIVQAMGRAVLAGQASPAAIMLALTLITAQVLSMLDNREAAFETFVNAVKEELERLPIRAKP